MAALERFGAYNDSVSVFQPALLGFKVNESDLVDIATELGNNASITSLNLSRIPISAEAAAAIGKTLGEYNCNVVHHVQFAQCALHAGEVAPLAQALAINPRIEAADFSQNPLRDEGTTRIGKMLLTAPLLRVLDLTECKIGPTGAAALSNAIATNTKLRHLVLAGNKLREAGAVALCEGLAKNTCIQILDLSGNSINREGGRALAQLLRGNKTLEAINLSTNFLSDSIPYIASAMCERKTTARLLDISSNRITSEICQSMAQVLEGHKFSIACFSIAKNAVGDVGLVALFHAFKGTGLQFLDLSEAELSSHSGVVLSDLISACPMLSSLQIDGNVFGDDAMTEVVHAFAKSKALASLNLERTAIGVPACAVLADAIRAKGRLRALSLADNPRVGLEGVLRVLDAISTLATVEEVDISALALAENEHLLRALTGCFLSNARLQVIKLEHNPVGRSFGPEGALTRQAALALLDKAAQSSAAGASALSVVSASGVANASGGFPVGAGGLSLSHHGSGGASKSLVHAAAANTTAHMQLQAFRPLWATLVPLEHPESTYVRDDDDAEDGARPPLVPHPNSIHSAMYPGYGRGRFSPGTHVQTLSNPVPYNVDVSRGTPPLFCPTGDNSMLLSVAPRRPLKQSPYSIAVLENNPGALPVTSDQLRRKFQELDVEGNGWLDKEAFKALYKSFQSFGLRVSEREVEETFAKTCQWSKSRLNFDEFCVLMLMVARR